MPRESFAAKARIALPLKTRTDNLDRLVNHTNFAGWSVGLAGVACVVIPVYARCFPKAEEAIKKSARSDARYTKNEPEKIEPVVKKLSEVGVEKFAVGGQARLIGGTIFCADLKTWKTLIHSRGTKDSNTVNRLIYEGRVGFTRSDNGVTLMNCKERVLTEKLATVRFNSGSLRGENVVVRLDDLHK